MIDPGDPNVRAAIRDLFASLEEQRLREITAWAVVTVDLMSDQMSVSGPYADPADAVIEAACGDARLNEGLEDGELGWRSHVAPLFPPGK